MRFPAIAVCSILLAGCTPDALEPLSGCTISNAERVHDVECFELPAGEFRGGVWPSSEAPFLELVVVRRRLFGPDWEAFYRINASDRFLFGGEVRCDSREKGKFDGFTRQEVQIAGFDGNWLLKMPQSPIPYRCSVLRNGKHGPDLLVVMNPSERRARGFVGVAKLDLGL